MPYSPIRLEQLNIPQLSGYILEITAGVYVLTMGNQNIEGVKTFLDGLIGYDSLNQPVLSTLDRTISGNWQYGGQTLGPSGLVGLSFLQNGQFNLPQTVRTTGNQTISGNKTFSDTAAFGIGEVCYIGNGLGPFSNGAGIYGGGDIGIDITSGVLYEPDLPKLNWQTNDLFGSWSHTGPTAGGFGIVTPSYLQTGDFNLLNTVRTTGIQTVAGGKNFLDTVSFQNSQTVSIGDDLIGLTSGTAIYSDGDSFIDFGNGGRLGDAGNGVTLDWVEKQLSSNWEAQNLKTNAARINRKVINSTGYTVLSSDYYLAVNTSGSAKTLIFPQASDNRIYKIKDVAGQATGNSITLSGSGVTFDYQSVYVISDAYASIELIAGSGNNYEVF
jgi:hypothetical protein